MKLGKENRVEAIILFFLFLLSMIPLCVAFAYPQYLNDDSFITLTFAKNLAMGKGFIYNQPPPVLGTTTPLFTLIIAGLASIFSIENIVKIAVLLTALSCVGVSWVFYLFRDAWRISSWQVLMISLAVNGSIWIGFLGMEAYLFSFLLVLSLSLLLNRNYGWLGFSAGLLFLTRGEGVLILAVAGIALIVEHYSSDEKRFAFRRFFRHVSRMMAGFIVPIIFWIIYALSVFGAILPNTLRAKQAQGQSEFGISFMYRLFTQWIPNWGNAFSLGGKFSFINFWWVFIASGLVYIFLRNRRWLLFIGWMFLYIAGYSILDVSAYWWYQLPILFIMNLLFGLGLGFMLQFIMDRISCQKMALGASIFLIAVVCLVLGHSIFSSFNTFQGDFRGPYYIALSEWFNQHADSSESIGYIEVGYLGFYTDNQIIDLAGLVTPDVVPYVSEGDFARGFWYHEPDYFIHLPEFDWALGGIRDDPRFQNNYVLVFEMPGFTGSNFMIYKHQ